MADTTPTNVQAIAKHLKNVSSDTLQMYIDDAKLELSDYNVSSKYQEKLQRYLAAHFATLDYRRPDSQKIGDLQTSYSSRSGLKDFESTEYGQEFKRLLRKASGAILKVM